jgi:ATP/maltotriose-dependent transcriptional regulator MalT
VLQSFISANLRSFACLVGVGAQRAQFDEFLEAARQAMRYIPVTMQGLYGGYDDLAACELAYFRNRPGECRLLALRAAARAGADRQYEVEAMAVFYLLRAAMQEGEYALAREMLEQLRSMLDNPDFLNRQLIYDLYTGYFFAQAGLPSQAASWLTSNAGDCPFNIHIPTRELLTRIGCLVSSGRHDEALSVLIRPGPEPQERFLMGELVRRLLSATAKWNTGDADGAAADFERAWALSFSGEFEMPFVELGKSFHPLAAAAAKRAGSAIPRAWLSAMEHKASRYAKKLAFVAGAYKKEHNIREDIQLSERERQVLTDLYHGFTRAEIAASRYLSVNTIKTILHGLYAKLGAENNVDAVRIALEKNLL